MSTNNVAYLTQLVNTHQTNLTKKGGDKVLYENIKKAANDKGMSINKVETELGLGKAVISKWNRNRPSIDKVARVASLLDVPIETLIDGDVRGDEDG